MSPAIPIFAVVLAVLIGAWTWEELGRRRRAANQAPAAGHRRHLPASSAQLEPYGIEKAYHRLRAANEQLARAHAEALAENEQLRAALHWRQLDDQARRRAPRNDDVRKLLDDLHVATETGEFELTDLERYLTSAA